MRYRGAARPNKSLQWTHGNVTHCAREKSTMRAITACH
jgi:hypothetical protein